MKGDNYSLARELISQGFSYPEVFRFLVKNAGLDYESAIHVIRVLDVNKQERFKQSQ